MKTDVVNHGLGVETTYQSLGTSLGILSNFNSFDNFMMSRHGRRLLVGLAAVLLLIALTGGQASHHLSAADQSLQLNQVPPTVSAQASTPATGASDSGSSGTSQGTSSNSSSTKITVNGQTVNVDGNGSYHQTTTSGDSQTTIDVNNSSNGSGNNSSSSVNVSN